MTDAPISDDRLRDILRRYSAQGGILDHIPTVSWKEVDDMARELLSLRAASRLSAAGEAVAKADAALVNLLIEAVEPRAGDVCPRMYTFRRDHWLIEACRAARAAPPSEPGGEGGCEVDHAAFHAERASIAAEIEAVAGKLSSGGGSPELARQLLDAARRLRSTPIRSPDQPCTRPDHEAAVRLADVVVGLEARFPVESVGMPMRKAIIAYMTARHAARSAPSGQEEALKPEEAKQQRLCKLLADGARTNAASLLRGYLNEPELTPDGAEHVVRFIIEACLAEAAYRRASEGQR